jgi:hypothetical protein
MPPWRVYRTITRLCCAYHPLSCTYLLANTLKNHKTGWQCLPALTATTDSYRGKRWNTAINGTTAQLFALPCTTVATAVADRWYRHLPDYRRLAPVGTGAYRPLTAYLALTANLTAVALSQYCDS